MVAAPLVLLTLALLVKSIFFPKEALALEWYRVTVADGASESSDFYFGPGRQTIDATLERTEDEAKNPSETHSQKTPPSVVFQTPPAQAPK